MASDERRCEEGGTPPATAEFAYRMFKSGDAYQAEFQNLICGQCHSQPVGDDSLGMHNQPPLDQDNRMMPPGTSRRAWRASYVTRTDGDPRTAFWDGGIHSRLDPARQ